MINGCDQHSNVNVNVEDNKFDNFDDVKMDGEDDAECDDMIGIYEELGSLSVGMKIKFHKLWIDLKNNKGITSIGVDKLNSIYANKLEPCSNFVVNVERCSYKPNPHWDLSLL